MEFMNSVRSDDTVFLIDNAECLSACSIITLKDKDLLTARWHSLTEDCQVRINVMELPKQLHGDCSQ